MSPPALLPYIVAEAIPNLSIRGATCLPIMKGVRFSIEDGGAVVRENPGKSKVVIVKVSDRSGIILSKVEQSPSPDGINIR
jgi:hypothetical protein